MKLEHIQEGDWTKIKVTLTISEATRVAVELLRIADVDEYSGDDNVYVAEQRSFFGKHHLTIKVLPDPE